MRKTRKCRKHQKGGNYTKNELEAGRQLEELGRNAANDKMISLQGFGLSKLPIPIPKNVLDITLDDNNFKELPVLHDKVFRLSVKNNPLERLPEKLPADLLELHLQNTLIKELPDLPTNLEVLNISDTNIDHLPPALPNSLFGLLMSNTKITELNALPPACETLVASGSPLSTIGPFPAGIKHITIEDALITELPPTPSSLTILSVKNVPLIRFPTDLPDKMNHLVISNIRARSGRLPRILESCNIDSNFKPTNTSPILILAGIIVDSVRINSQIELDAFIKYTRKGQHLRDMFVFFGDRKTPDFANSKAGNIPLLEVPAGSTNAIMTEIRNGNILALQSDRADSTAPDQYAIIRPSNDDGNYERAKTIYKLRVQLRGKPESVLTRKPFNVTRARLKRAKVV